MSGTNALAFDPLHPSPAEQDDMVRGYLDGCAGRPPVPDGSIAYAHGRAVGVNDRLGVVEQWQRDLIARRRTEVGA